MDVKEKVAEALRHSLNPQHVHLEDDNGIIGFVVSAQFQRMSALDRQTLIDRALRNSPVKLTRSEMHKVLAIAGLTPAEYEAHVE